MKGRAWIAKVTATAVLSLFAYPTTLSAVLLQEGDMVVRTQGSAIWKIDTDTGINTFVGTTSIYPLAVNGDGLFYLSSGLFYDAKTSLTTFDPLLNLNPGGTRDVVLEDNENILVLTNDNPAPQAIYRLNLRSRTFAQLAQVTNGTDNWRRIALGQDGTIFVLDTNENSNTPGTEIHEVDPVFGDVSQYYEFGPSQPGVVNDLAVNDLGDIFLVMDYSPDGRGVSFLYRIPANPVEEPHFVEPFVPPDLWAGQTQALNSDSHITAYGSDILTTNALLDFGYNAPTNFLRGVVRLDPYTGSFLTYQAAASVADVEIVPTPTPFVTSPLWPIEFTILEQSLYACSSLTSLEGSSICGRTSGGPELELSFANPGVPGTAGTFRSSNVDGQLTLNIAGNIQNSVSFFAVVKISVTIPTAFTGSIQDSLTEVAHILEDLPQDIPSLSRRIALRPQWIVSNSTPSQWTVADSHFLGPDSEWIDRIENTQAWNESLLEIGSALPARTNKETRIQSLLGGDTLIVEFPIEITLEGVPPGEPFSHTVTYRLSKLPEPGATTALVAGIILLVLLERERKRTQHSA